MKQAIPWWAKIGVKILLARTPVSYRLWEKMGLFVHGYMNDPSYAVRIFQEHFKRVQLSKVEQFTVLELGPGDSVLSALVARAHGASKCYLVDSGEYANRDIDIYRTAVEVLQGMGLSIEKVPVDTDFDSMLEYYRGNYLVEGLRSLRSIPDNSVDFIWSQAVLEHVRLHDFDETMHELKRILGKDGVMSHRIDLKDHLATSLNNLRFSKRIWESDFMAKSGFYTNRIRAADMTQRFKKAGFGVNIVKIDRWESVPVSRKKLASEFSSLSDDELRISGFDVILTPASDH